MQAAWCY